MEPLHATGDRMYDADQHLDRLGTILRSLRAPSDRVPTTTTTTSTAARKPSRQHGGDSSFFDSPSTPPAASHHRQVPLRQQQHCVQKQPSSAPPERRRTSTIDISQRQGTPYRQRVNRVNAGGLSSAVDRREEPDIHTSQQARGECSQNDTTSTGLFGAVIDRRNASPAKPTSRLDSAILTVQPPPPHNNNSSSASTLPPTTTGAAGGGAVPTVGCVNTLDDHRGTPAPGSTPFRQRVIRTWWRGLSCGVCFAAGAWARDGHGVLGVALALAAVCGELMLHERVAAVVPLDYWKSPVHDTVR